MGTPHAIEWIRVSSQGQADAGTHEAQRHALDRLRETRPAHIVERVEALGVSGALPLAERPDAQRVEALLRRGGVDELRVVALDRITRSDDLGERVHILSACQRAGVVIVEASGRVTDPRQTMGQVDAVMRGAWAAEERHRIAERMAGGKARAAREGRVTGGEVPYGYTRSGKTVAIDEETSAIVRRIYSMASEASCSAIADVLNAEAVPTARGGSGRWDRRRVAKVLRQSCYMGSRTQTIGGETYTQDVPQIITQDVWERAQRALDARQRHDGRPAQSGQGLCQGLLCCAECGQPMVRHATDRRYLCRSRHERRYAPACANVRHPVSVIDERVWAEVVRLATDPDALRVAFAPEPSEDRASTWAEQLAGAERRMEQLRRTQSDWLTLSRRGLLHIETLESHLRSMVVDMETCQRTAQVAREAMAAEEAAREAMESTRETLASLAGRIASTAPEHRRGILETLVPRLDGYGVHVSRDGSIELVLAIPSAPSAQNSGGNAPTKVGSDSGDRAHFGGLGGDGQVLPIRRRIAR